MKSLNEVNHTISNIENFPIILHKTFLPSYRQTQLFKLQLLEVAFASELKPLESFNFSKINHEIGSNTTFFVRPIPVRSNAEVNTYQTKVTNIESYHTLTLRLNAFRDMVNINKSNFGHPVEATTLRCST